VEEALSALQQAHAAQGDALSGPRAPGREGQMASIVERTRDFTTEVVAEIKKVTWPDWPQLKQWTIVVIIFVVIVSAIIWLMDLGVRGVLGVIMNLFSS